MKTDFQSIRISEEQAQKIALELFGKKGTVHALPGELDFNFKIQTDEEAFILKVSRPNEDEDYIDFQSKILVHVSKSIDESPRVILDKKGEEVSYFIDENDRKRLVRMLSWTEGRLWSSVNPIRPCLLESLGEKAGQLTSSLQGFDHPRAHRILEWDPAQSLWTKDFLHLFEGEEKEIVQHFQELFEDLEEGYLKLRKQVVHNDVNDNNIIVSGDLVKPKVKAIIDFGDAVYTQSINDLGVVLAYGIMDKNDALESSRDIIKGYHGSFPLLEEELDYLYSIVSMQLLITVTKAAINKVKEPENEYLQISAQPAWEALNKWIQVHPNLAKYHFRSACGFEAHPNQSHFENWVKKKNCRLSDLFPEVNCDQVYPIDMSVSSTWLGHEFEYSDLDLTEFKINQLAKEQADCIIAGGYDETRVFYSTDAYKKEGNQGPKWRTIHLGVDYWLPAETKIHALFDGVVRIIHHNDYDKDYGPTLILEHQTDDGIPFFTLYGHLSLTTLKLWKQGDQVKKGELIAYLGNQLENGGWAPHLHFQILLDLLGETENYPGVGFPDERKIWKSICPNPHLLFDLDIQSQPSKSTQEILGYRKAHLGKSLSVSYDQPLNIVRGSGLYLINDEGQKFMDTVNNVAHVGHEHPRVVKAAQHQTALLNTNTRYLHQNITDFAGELLATFPKELSVVHFVNSGSEANELAMRMAKTFTGQKDLIAVEIGYHGNTQACIDVSSYKFDGKGGEGSPEHTHIVPLPDTFRGIYQGDGTGEKYAHHVQDQIEKLKSLDRKPAAFICESIISCGGQIELPENYLKKAYEYVRNVGGLCIADEVQVGMGRVGSQYWGFQLHGVIPDILTIGKPIGNGHPLAAVVCTEEVAEKFANGMEYFNTFGGNPVSCAIGKEVLAVIREENLQEQALKVGDYLKSELVKLQYEHPIIQDIRGQGLFLGFEFVNEEKNPLPKKASYFANRMRDFNILMSTDGKDHNAIKIKPPMIFDKENCDELIGRMKQVLSEDYIKK